ncbi:hypothetical protein PGT21_032774 [Puccinia graminis f. sp. tritici]|uniref:Uncharacterized protein n=1 Tax=Puccinia graminis f. sp. tritici TaxID=56615 RepID=A0A5B0QPK7_PUCGR|nr:hypothetical protein PGT21_032774 [Puccinia graminis f. sp. tritici]
MIFLHYGYRDSGIPPGDWHYHHGAARPNFQETTRVDQALNKTQLDLYQSSNNKLIRRTE